MRPLSPETPSSSIHQLPIPSSSTVNTTTPSSIFIKNFNSLYNPTLTLDDINDNDKDNSSCCAWDSNATNIPIEAEVATAFASRRFFSSPSRSNSIMGSVAATNHHRHNHHHHQQLFDNSMAVPTYSLDPYLDFRRLMQEMVEAHPKLRDMRSNWKMLHEMVVHSHSPLPAFYFLLYFGTHGERESVWLSVLCWVPFLSAIFMIAHWIHHKHECERLQQQLKNVDVLYDFPFTFSREATFQVCGKKETRCSFLANRGLHQVGLWMHECHCGASCASFDCLRLYNRWDLPRIFCPCFGPESPISEKLNNWRDYYNWRCIPLDSPVALLLHWILTIYHALQLIGITSLNPEISDKLYIHYLGPEKELLQLAVFGELQAFFPRVCIQIELVGPAIPLHRDGERISISQYACCNEDECVCKLSGENVTSAVTLQLWRGFYHDRYRDIVKDKDSFPHLVIAPNAGVAAYSSWLPSIELMKKMNMPVVFTDYCEEACHLAACCIEAVTGRSLRLPVQLNPFRQPIVVEDSVLLLPCYSNCFLFGM
ncbi:zinc finger MYND domain-containing protein 15 [Senna tora]|uniref:Zinc finger MYND domain-containing protein 15 n=1 Tax=Senna tora TaxID=362788 RepID=A0A834WRJ4_9FABA|nr:zinc finger MYND domain-containing protein 15 [Senna tora]